MPRDRQESFIDRYADFAMDVAAVTGMAPEVVLGQAALETGWGKSVAGNNMFGVKGKGQSVTTHEDIPGRGLVKSVESFRAYDNPEDSFADYGRLMNTDRYNGIGPNQTVGQQIAAIGKSGYATDRNYASKLGSVVDRIQESKVFQDKVVNSIAALDPAEVDFTGVPFNESPLDDWSGHINPVPAGTVEFAGALPDLTPQQPASAGSFFGGYDLADITLPADAYTDIGYGMQDFETERALADMRMSAYDRGFYGQQPVDDMPDIMSQFDQGAYPDITAGIFGNPLDGFAPIDTAPVDFSGVRQGMTEQQAIDAWGLGNQRPSENVEIRPGTPGFGENVDMASRYRDDLNSTYDVQAGLYSHELSGFGTQYDGTPPAAAMAARNFGYDDPWSSPAVDFSDITDGILHDDPVAPTSSPGFAAGFDEGPWGATGDFNAPSLAARNNMDRFEGAMAVRNQSAPTNEAIASNVMAELAPQAPALAAPSFSAPPSTPSTPAQPAAQSFDPQAMALGDMEDKIGMPRDFSTPALAAPSLPSTPAPSTPTVAQGDVPEISARVSPKAASTRAVSTPSLAPARAAPVSARAVSAPVAAPVAAFAPAPVAQPSLFGTIASLFGSGPSGYQGSGLIGDTYSNDRGFRDPGGWSLGNLDRDFAASLMDGSAYGQYGPQPGGWFGGLFGEGGLFGGGAGTGGTRGDGSYSDSAGYNDNNPQGIL